MIHNFLKWQPCHLLLPCNLVCPNQVSAVHLSSVLVACQYEKLYKSIKNIKTIQNCHFLQCHHCLLKLFCFYFFQTLRLKQERINENFDNNKFLKRIKIILLGCANRKSFREASRFVRGDWRWNANRSNGGHDRRTCGEIRTQASRTS